MTHTYRFIFDYPDETGLIAEHNGWITESVQHSEEGNNWYY